MSILNKEAILNAEDLARKTVNVPEWGGDVILRTFTAAERDNWDASLFTDNGKERKMNYQNIRARLLAFTLIDENGNRLFSEEDIDVLGGKSGLVLDRLFNTACELNGMGATDIKALEKN